MLKSICLSLSDEEVRIPSTINIQLLNEYDYIPTFHHHISFVSHLIPNIDTIENFPAFWTSRGEERFPNGLPNQLHHPECILNPAVCLHIYPLFRNDKLPTNCLRTVTAVGKVFRNESGNHSLFDRLFEFSMREIVSFGDNITISTQAERLILLLKSLGDALELDFRLITASDMFIGKNNQARIFSQLSTQAKIEMEVHIPHTQEHLACASLNRHADHFSKPMNIKVENSNNLGETLCLGFGIERLAYALVAQHGSLAGEIVKSVDVKTLVSSLNPSGGAR